MPLAQLLELVTHLTGASKHELEIPARFSFKQPLRIMTPRTSFYNCLTKLSPFESLDVVCLTRDDIGIEPHNDLMTANVMPPKDLVRTLFLTYSNVFKVNQTEHTLLYYLYKIEQIRAHYQMTDLVQVVALDLLRQAHSLKQDEPTIMDAHNQSFNAGGEEPLPNSHQKANNDYERTDSPLPQVSKKSSVGQPFRISLLEMPIDPGSAEKGQG